MGVVEGQGGPKESYQDLSGILIKRQVNFFTPDLNNTLT